MTDQYITRFRAGTGEQRRAAIMKLGKGGDSRAISVLQQIARSEPDPALKKLAAQAIQHLQKAAEPASSASLAVVPNPSAMNMAARTPAIDPDVIDAEVIDEHNASALSAAIPDAAAEPPRRKIVTDQQRNLAKSKLDQVITHQMADEYPQALVRLAEAAALDPDILNTTIGNNLAQTLTDLPRDQAVAEVLARSQALGVKKARSTPTIKVESGELVDTLIESGLLVLLLLVSSSVSNATNVYAAAYKLGTPAVLVAKDIFLGSLLPTVLAYVGLLVSMIATFVVGIMLGGSSGVLRFIRFVTRSYLISYALLSIGSLPLFVLFMQVSQSRATTFSAAQSTLLSIAGIISLIGGLVALFGQPYAVARAHKFGYFKGCISVVVGIVVLAVLFAIVGVGTLTALTNGFSSH